MTASRKGNASQSTGCYSPYFDAGTGTFSLCSDGPKQLLTISQAHAISSAPVKTIPLISTIVSGICLMLSVWLFVVSNSNNRLAGAVQREQETVQVRQQEVQLKRSALEAQEAQINTAVKLAQESGPAILKDLASLAAQNNNEKIKALLEKHGLTIVPAEPAEPAEQQSTESGDTPEEN